MTKKLSNHAHAAKLIRAELKKNGIKARVRASTASMTSSVDVYILEDILPATLTEIKAFVGQFEYGHFDGMTDCYEYSNTRDDLPQVKFAFVHVEYSDEIKQEIRDYLGNVSEGWNGDQEISRVLSGMNCKEFWSSRKPKVDSFANL